MISRRVFRCRPFGVVPELLMFAALVLASVSPWLTTGGRP